MSSVPPAHRVDVLVVAAHGPDLRGLRDHLGKHLDGTVRGLHVSGKTIGVGMAIAGAATSKRAFQLRPRAIIHVGTAGIYPGLSEFRPHDVLVASDLVLVDPGTLAGKSAFPEPMQTRVSTDPMLTAGLATMSGRAPICLGSPMSTTISDELAQQLPTLVGCQGESLEAFAVGQACRFAEIPFTCVLGASHVVGSRAREYWRAYERQSGIAAAEAVIGWIANGAQGLPHEGA